MEKPLCTIFNCLFVTRKKNPEDGGLPLLHIKKDDKKSASNYRPFSLVSILCKPMEKVIRKRIANQMDRLSLFSNIQFGFLGGRPILTNSGSRGKLD